MTKAAKSSKAAAPLSIDQQVAEALLWLKKHGDKTRREEMGPRYGVHTDKAWGVAMADMLKYAKQLGRNHDLALALWDAEWYEARMLASMVDEPEKVTPAQMERWCKDFDNWGICDTVCFKLFDQSPHAWTKADAWTKRKDEFQKRAGFALLACLALHGRGAENSQFAKYLSIIEAHADDERNFVKKAVNWALRAIGGRNAELNAAAVAVAQRLAASESAAAKWNGKDALRELAKRAKVTAKPTKPAKSAKAEKPATGTSSDAVLEYITALDHPLKAELEAVRKIILGVNKEIVEGIKWNAPSFYYKDWFATTGLRSKDFVHLVFHTGAKVKASATAGVKIDDPSGLLEWHAKDRCSAKFYDMKDVKAKKAALQEIVRQWLKLM